MALGPNKDNPANLIGPLEDQKKEAGPKEEMSLTVRFLFYTI